MFQVGNLKELAKKTLELISNYRKDAEFKVNKQKSINFLYNNNEQVEFEMKKHNIIYISTQERKQIVHRMGDNIFGGV